MKKQLLLKELSEEPGHFAGEVLYKVIGGGHVTHVRAHTAHIAWSKARVHLGNASFNDCEFEIIDETKSQAPADVPSNGKAHELSHASALSRIVVLEALVERLREDNSDLRVRESKLHDRLANQALGKQRSKPSPKALKKLIPRKKRR